ncbi:TPA: hypothetical protein U1C91_000941 [Streptococcus suis]|nr:hypothetical protein [Streptococcus suis]HEM3700346.1 hypothetical protein [Streptococcus suis]
MSKFRYTIRCKDCQRYSTVTDDDGCELNCPKCLSERLVVIYEDVLPEPEDEDRAYDEWKDNVAMGYEV